MAETVLTVRRPRRDLRSTRGLDAVQRLLIDAPMHSLDGLERATNLRGLTLHKPVEDLGALSGRELHQVAFELDDENSTDLRFLNHLRAQQLMMTAGSKNAVAKLSEAEIDLTRTRLLSIADEARTATLRTPWLEGAPELTTLSLHALVPDSTLHQAASLPRLEHFAWQPTSSTQERLGLRLLGDRAEALIVPEADGRVTEIPDDPPWWFLRLDLMQRWGILGNLGGEDLLREHLSQHAPHLLDHVTVEADAQEVTLTATQPGPLEEVLDLMRRARRQPDS